jgi:hypothetical protein
MLSLRKKKGPQIDHYSFVLLSRKAFPTTETELKLMTVAAKRGNVFHSGIERRKLQITITNQTKFINRGRTEGLTDKVPCSFYS